MTPLVKILIGLSGLLHVGIFFMESVFFLNEKIYSRFLVASFEDAQTLSLFAYNQGWYNLFLAIAALLGIALNNKLPKNVGTTLSLYAALSMLAAAIVLAASAPELFRAAFIQGIFPLIALILFTLSSRKRSPA
jgi:putative membrane protein